MNPCTKDRSALTRRLSHLALLAAVLIFGGCSAAPLAPDASARPESALLMLTRGGIELGILPDAGGRAVLLRRTGGANVLLSDPAIWSKRPPTPATDAPWVDYGGHIVWLGPQADWWSQQDLDADRLRRKAVWPPDPWIEYGRFEILEKTDASVRLKGPASPLSGLRMVKTYALADDGTVTFEVAAENTRATPVHWGLWSNTRMPRRTRAYCEPKVQEILRLDFQTKPPAVEIPLWPQMVDGMFTFQLPETLGDATAAASKAFIVPKQGWVAGVTRSDAFIKRFEPAAKEAVPTGQAPAEIYQMLGATPVLELECQGAHRTLKPGERMNWRETWQVVAYGGADRPKDQVKFLRKLTRGVASDRRAGGEQ